MNDAPCSDAAARLAASMLVVAGGFTAGAIGGTWGFLAVLAAMGGLEPWHEARIDALAGVAQYVDDAIRIVTAISFLVWQWKALDRLHDAPPEPGVDRPSKSVVWWIVPFACFVVPVRQVASVYRRWALRPAAWLPGAWWASFLLMSVVGPLAGTELAESPAAALTLSVIVAVTTFLAALLAVRIVVETQRGIEGASLAPAPARDLLSSVIGAPARSIGAVGLVTAALLAFACATFRPA